MGEYQWVALVFLANLLSQKVILAKDCQVFWSRWMVGDGIIDPFIRKCGIGVPTAEPPATGLTETLGTKGGGFLPFQALRSTDSV